MNRHAKLRTCARCKEQKEPSNFWMRSDTGTRSSYCDDCRRIKDREQKRKAYKSNRFAAYLGLHKHNPAIVEDMVWRGVAACEICGSSHRLHVDHCHANGLVRGLLCNKCNAALGMVSDDPSLLRKLAEYLEERIEARLAPKPKYLRKYIHEGMN